MPSPKYTDVAELRKAAQEHCLQLIEADIGRRLNDIDLDHLRGMADWSGKSPQQARRDQVRSLAARLDDVLEDASRWLEANPDANWQHPRWLRAMIAHRATFVAENGPLLDLERRDVHLSGSSDRTRFVFEFTRSARSEQGRARARNPRVIAPYSILAGNTTSTMMNPTGIKDGEVKRPKGVTLEQVVTAEVGAVRETLKIIP